MAKHEKRDLFDKAALIFNAVTLVLLILNFGFSIYIFRDQSKLTRESNDINRQAYVAVQRAFIIVEGLEITPIKDKDGKINSWKIFPIIENSGDTPTQNMRVRVLGGGSPSSENMKRMPEDVKTEIMVEFPPDPEEIFSEDYFKKDILPISSLGPKEKYPDGTPSNIPSGLNSDFFLNIFSGEFRNTISGTIHYDDIFSNSPPHITKFCYELLAGKDINGDITPAYRGCKHWNCSDKECDIDKAEYDAEVQALPSHRLFDAKHPK